MATETGYSERYEQALRLATAAHRHQNRKGSDLPYISHPVHVSVILLHYGFPTDVAIAGLLHDVVEDQGVDLAQIEEQFGACVAELVVALSERKTDAQGIKRPWEVRKQEALEHVCRGGPEVVAIKAADVLHNARATALDARQNGPAVWRRFTRGPAALLDHYRQIVQIARAQLPGHPLVDELADAVEDLAQAIDEVSTVRIEHFADHVDTAPTLARWILNEWGYLLPGHTFEDVVAMYEKRTVRGQIPETFVALEGDTVVGAASIIEEDMETRTELSPWLAEVYVAPEFRRRGIGSALVRTVVQEAQDLGVRRLYLFTPDKMAFYQHLGWEILERTDYYGKTMTIMSYESES